MIGTRGEGGLPVGGDGPGILTAPAGDAAGDEEEEAAPAAAAVEVVVVVTNCRLAGGRLPAGAEMVTAALFSFGSARLVNSGLLFTGCRFLRATFGREAVRCSSLFSLGGGADTATDVTGDAH